MYEIPVTMIGTVVADVKMIDTKAGASLASFRMACNERRFNKQSNSWVDGDTTYVTVNSWRQLAENVNQSLSRGDQVVVTGRLRVREWEKDDRKGTSVEIEAQAIGHDLARGTTSLSKSTKVVSAMDPWTAAAVDGMSSLAKAAGIAPELMDAAIISNDGR